MFIVSSVSFSFHVPCFVGLLQYCYRYCFINDFYIGGIFWKIGKGGSDIYKGKLEGSE